jgi:transcriptional regulator of met regulon
VQKPDARLHYKIVRATTFRATFTPPTFCIVKENIALIYDEWNTITMGVQIMFPSDLAKYVSANIDASAASEEIKKLRVEIVRKLGEISDRSVRRDMIELNKAIAHNLHSDYFMTNHKAFATCMGIPDTSAGGKCENITSDVNVTPPLPHDYLGHLGHELKKRDVSVNTGNLSCEMIIPCIYTAHMNSTGNKLLYFTPGWPNDCPSDCDALLRYDPVGDLQPDTQRWRIGTQTYPCGTRRSRSVLCQHFPSESRCICEALIQANAVQDANHHRGKRSVRTFFRSVAKLLRKTPRAIWHSIKKHPFRSTGTVLGGAAGIYTIYELIDSNLVNPIPSHRELVEYFDDMRQRDQAVQNITDTVYLMLGKTRQNMIELQKDMLDTIAGVESWSDQLTLIATIFSSTSDRIRATICRASLKAQKPDAGLIYKRVRATTSTATETVQQPDARLH